LPVSLSLRLSMPLTSPWSEPFKYYVLYPPRWIVCLDSYPFFLFPISLGTPTLWVKNLRLHSFCLQISDDIKSFHYFTQLDTAPHFWASTSWCESHIFFTLRQYRLRRIVVPLKNLQADRIRDQLREHIQKNHKLVRISATYWTLSRLY